MLIALAWGIGNISMKSEIGIECFAFRAYSCAAWCLMDLGLFGLVVYLCCLLMVCFALNLVG